MLNIHKNYVFVSNNPSHIGILLRNLKTQIAPQISSHYHIKFDSAYTNSSSEKKGQLTTEIEPLSLIFIKSRLMKSSNLRSWCVNVYRVALLTNVEPLDLFEHGK